MAYPIKGTKYYEDVTENVTTDKDWLTRTDRDLGVNGRYSPRFYAHATRWLVNTVNLEKARLAGSRNWPAVTKMFINAQRGRLGMRLTEHDREGDEGQNSGRGWLAKERAADAW